MHTPHRPPRVRSEAQHPIGAPAPDAPPSRRRRPGDARDAAGMIRRHLVMFAVLLCTLAAGGARAEQVVVRAGEHPGFSRLVLPFARPVGWRLAPAPGGYILSLSRDDISFDLSGVFRLIPRTRLSAVTRSGPAGLRLDLACRCGAEAFWLDDPYRLVIDLGDDPAPGDARQGGRRRGGREASTNTALAPAAGRALPAAARRVPAERPIPPTSGDEGAAPAADEGHPPPPALIPISPRVALLPSPRTAATRRGRAGISGAASQAPAASTQTRPRPSGARAGTTPPGIGPARPALDAGAAGPDTGTAAPGSGRASEAETALREKLSRAVARAAAQGLLSADVAPVPVPAPAEAAGGPDAAAAPAPDGATADSGSTAPEGGPDPRDPSGAGTSAASEGAATPMPGLRLGTSIDSALAESAGANDIAPPSPCRSNRGYDIPSWALSGTPADMIGAARAGLVDATGTPRPEGLQRLVETYLHLGFGAEARAILDRFGEMPGAPAYRDLARIMDPQVAAPAARLTDQLGCDGPVALWAALARDDLAGVAALDLDAIVRAFAALPAHLRRRFGPDLAARVQAIGATDKAAAIANATRRAVPAEAPPGMVALMEARTALSAGARAEALAGLDRLVATGGDAAPVAAALLIETRLAGGEAPAPATVEAARAFAREYRDEPIAGRLSRAVILGEAALGRFDAAFRGFDTLGPAARGDLAGALFARLAADAGSDALLRHLVARIDNGEMPPLAPVPALALAGRLIDLDFPDRAGALMEAVSPAPEAAATAMLEARLALASGAPETALARLAGVDSAAAQSLRAKAAEAAGDLEGALQAALAAGATERAARLAWRLGAWAEVARLGPPPRRALAEYRLAAPPGVPAPEAAPPRLATARTLIETSRERRAVLSRLLDTTAFGGVGGR